MVTKMHHAAIDGVTGADLMAHLFDLSADAGSSAAAGGALAAPMSSRATSSWPSMRFRHVVGNPVRMAKVLRRTVRSVVDVVQQQRGSSDEGPSPAMPFSAPRTRWTAAITPHRVVAFGKATLDDMRHVKSTFGTTVNDVVLAPCTHDAAPLPRGPRRPARPAPRVLGARCRCTARARARAPTRSRRCSCASRCSSTTRSRSCARSTRRPRSPRSCRTPSAPTRSRTSPSSSHPRVFNRAMRLYSNFNLADRHRPVHNLVVSNVPGPPIPLYAAGAQVKGVFPFGPLLEGAGLNITVLSNMGHVDFGVIACRELVPDVWDIADGFGEAVDELQEARRRARRRRASCRPCSQARRQEGSRPASGVGERSGTHSSWGAVLTARLACPPYVPPDRDRADERPRRRHLDVASCGRPASRAASSTASLLPRWGQGRRRRCAPRSTSSSKA